MVWILSFCIVVISNGCNKSAPSYVSDSILAEKTSVKTYEIINLTTHQNLSEKHTASFGFVAIQLLKTSDSTSTFYVTVQKNTLANNKSRIKSGSTWGNNNIPLLGCIDLIYYRRKDNWSLRIFNNNSFVKRKEENLINWKI